jgi:hypothetical protein
MARRPVTDTKKTDSEETTDMCDKSKAIISKWQFSVM